MTSGSVDMDVAATLASLGTARSSVVLSERERKLLKIRYRDVLWICMYDDKLYLNCSCFTSNS